MNLFYFILAVVCLFVTVGNKDKTTDPLRVVKCWTLYDVQQHLWNTFTFMVINISP